MKLRRPFLKWISLGPFIAAATMLVLLPLLAALQYHWQGQLSESERDQMQTHLRATAGRFAEEFDREITRLFAGFLPEMEDDDKDRDALYAAKFSRWAGSAAYPGIVKSFYLATSNEQKQLELTEFDPTTQLFAPLAWPEKMTALRGELTKFLEPHRREDGPRRGDRPDARQSGVIPLYYLDSPMLIAPQRGSYERHREKGLNPPPPPQLDGFAIIELDLGFIQQEFLPALLKRNFLADDSASYEFKIVERRNPSRIIYPEPTSDGSDPFGRGAKADASAPLFGLRMDEIIKNFRRRAEPSPQQIQKLQKWRQRRGGGPGPPMGGFRQFFDREQQGLWEIQLRHRAGSLEAAVAKVRRQNLMISFGILALLGASVGLLIVSMRRASALARRQMDFVAGVSHELRTPLAVIESAAYNLDKGVVKTPQQIHNYGSLIRKETGRLKEMVEQMLEYAGVQSGRQPYHLQPADLNRILEDVLASSQPLFAEGGFQLETEIAPDLPPIMADQAALARAIQNLINNAMKYSGENRWISLRAQAVGGEAGATARITISDRGIGIPAEEQSHIFEPFYRGNEARAAQIHGNGLGLSLVKTIIAAHNGTISVKSAPNAGSTFSVLLPAIAASTTTDEETSSLGAKLSYEQANPAGRR
jgi:signal transduction histidine kinase